MFSSLLACARNKRSSNRTKWILWKPTSIKCQPENSIAMHAHVNGVVGCCWRYAPLPADERTDAICCVCVRILFYKMAIIKVAVLITMHMCASIPKMPIYHKSVCKCARNYADIHKNTGIHNAVAEFCAENVCTPPPTSADGSTERRPNRTERRWINRNRLRTRIDFICGIIVTRWLWLF